MEVDLVVVPLHEVGVDRAHDEQCGVGLETKQPERDEHKQLREKVRRGGGGIRRGGRTGEGGEEY